MGYLFIAGCGNGRALVMHGDEGKFYLYDFGNQDGTVSYTLVGADDELTPGPELTWSYYAMPFSSVDEMRVWWHYQRQPSVSLEDFVPGQAYAGRGG